MYNELVKKKRIAEHVCGTAGSGGGAAETGAEGFRKRAIYSG